MAISFPTNPAIGDEFSAGGFVWVWSGSSWDKVAAETEPPSFYLACSADGDTVFTFTEPLAAGQYSFEFADSTTVKPIDVYALNSTDQLIASSPFLVLNASQAISKIVILGASPNDGFIVQKTNLFTGTGNIGSNAALPAIALSATPAVLPNVNSTVTVTGKNFATNAGVQFIGQDNVARNAKSVVVASSTQLTATRPDVLPIAQEPYTISVVNPGTTTPSSAVNILVNVTDAGGPVTWVTTAVPLATVGVAYSFQLQATDADGSAISYSIASGSLQSGLSLSSAGVISGTATVQATNSVTFRATDAGGNSSDRTLSVQTSNPIVATGGTITTTGGFRYHTFTSSGTFQITSGTGNVDFFVLGGGGGGDRMGSSGGAGSGFIASTTQLRTTGSLTVTVGAGGANGDYEGASGAASSVAGVVSANGGSGVPWDYTPFGSAGGSGGGSDGGFAGGSNGSNGAGSNGGTGSGVPLPTWVTPILGTSSPGPNLYGGGRGGTAASPLSGNANSGAGGSTGAGGWGGGAGGSGVVLIRYVG